MVGAREMQLGYILKALKKKKLISIDEIDELIDVCGRVLAELVRRTGQREKWKARALEAEEKVKLAERGC